MDINKSIDATRAGFEDAFASGDFYNKQTQGKSLISVQEAAICLFRLQKIIPSVKLLDLILLSMRSRKIKQKPIRKS